MSTKCGICGCPVLPELEDEGLCPMCRDTPKATAWRNKKDMAKRIDMEVEWAEKEAIRSRQLLIDNLEWMARDIERAIKYLRQGAKVCRNLPHNLLGKISGDFENLVANEEKLTQINRMAQLLKGEE